MTGSSTLNSGNTATAAAAAASASGASSATTTITTVTSSLVNSFMFRFLCKIGTVGTGLIAIVAGLLYAKQESLLYFPKINGIPRRPSSNPRSYRSPEEHDIPFTEHMIKCSDNVSIHAWLLHQTQTPPQMQSRSKTSSTSMSSTTSSSSSSPTIIFFHGNAGNIGLRLPNAVQMYHRLGCNIFMVEYRGYGNSDTVKPNEAGLKLDAEAAYRYLLHYNNINNNNYNNHNSHHPTASYTNIDTQKIFVFGRSLGGAVAFHLASYAESIQSPLAGVMVENTFTSISQMVDQLMPAIAPLKFLVLRMKWDSNNIAPLLYTPILYLAGENDELVPHSQMLDLYTRSRGGNCVYSKIHVIEGGTHNDSWVQGGLEYYRVMKAFMSYVMLNGEGLLLKSRDVSSSSFEDGMGSTATTGSTTTTGTTTTSTKSTSMEVTMGGESQKSTSTTTSSGTTKSIPIMPSGILGMAKEVASQSLSSSNTASTDKKKEI